jgi:hypothetical protein
VLKYWLGIREKIRRVLLKSSMLHLKKICRALEEFFKKICPFRVSRDKIETLSLYNVVIKIEL